MAKTTEHRKESAATGEVASRVRGSVHGGPGEKLRNSITGASGVGGIGGARVDRRSQTGAAAGTGRVAGNKVVWRPQSSNIKGAKKVTVDLGIGKSTVMSPGVHKKKDIKPAAAGRYSDIHSKEFNSASSTMN